MKVASARRGVVDANVPACVVGAGELDRQTVACELPAVSPPAVLAAVALGDLVVVAPRRSAGIVSVDRARETTTGIDEQLVQGDRGPLAATATHRVEHVRLFRRTTSIVRTRHAADGYGPPTEALAPRRLIDGARVRGPFAVVDRA